MTAMTPEKLKALKDKDVEKMMDILQKEGFGRPSSYEVGEITLHKVRCRCTLLTYEEQKESAEWLWEHGYVPDGFESRP